jgi:tryptophan halogenase
VRFDQYWLKMRASARRADLADYSITRMASRQQVHAAAPDVANSPLADIAYAYHFDASLYARYLRGVTPNSAACAHRGQDRPGRAARQRRLHVDAVVLETASASKGDLFIDCSGFRGLLIEAALKTGFEDWSHWLPCDRAWPCRANRASADALHARHRAPAGWQWRIPLQHRTGNGHVYCSRHMSDDEAAGILLANLDGKALAEPRLRFTHRHAQEGLEQERGGDRPVERLPGAAGIDQHPFDPVAIARLVAFFPDRGFNQADIDEFNRQSRLRVRAHPRLHHPALQAEPARRLRVLETASGVRWSTSGW